MDNDDDDDGWMDEARSIVSTPYIQYRVQDEKERDRACNTEPFPKNQRLWFVRLPVGWSSVVVIAYLYSVPSGSSDTNDGRPGTNSTGDSGKQETRTRNQGTRPIDRISAWGSLGQAGR